MVSLNEFHYILYIIYSWIERILNPLFEYQRKSIFRKLKIWKFNDNWESGIFYLYLNKISHKLFSIMFRSNLKLYHLPPLKVRGIDSKNWTNRRDHLLLLVFMQMQGLFMQKLVESLYRPLLVEMQFPAVFPLNVSRNILSLMWRPLKVTKRKYNQVLNRNFVNFIHKSQQIPALH